ncbi:aminoacyl-histidine dipeptidase [Bacteroidota bacterium]
MGEVLGHLTPSGLWKHFEEICKRPHPSKKEEQLVEYVVGFGKKNNLETIKDDFGNVLIKKPATPGMESRKTVVLQGHLDMVPETNTGSTFNFEKDPIEPRVEGDWVKANGTTLGSDNGIGVAATLAVLESNDVEHGPIEALFTLDEETGMFGAAALKPDFMKGEIMLNMDSEEDGALYIGCAGGKNTYAKFDYTGNDAPAKTIAYEVTVSGLKGGHSGLDIHMGKGNAIKILGRLLWEMEAKFDIRLSKINAGSKHNAIPRESFAVVRIKEKLAEEFVESLLEFNNKIKNELGAVEPGFKITAEPVKSKGKVIDKKTTGNLLKALYAVPHGVLKMSADIAGLVETSTNLAVIKTTGKAVSIITSQRSSVDSEKVDAANTVAAVFNLAKADVKFGDDYPGWQPDINSPILGVMKERYKAAYGTDPEIKAIHAGLETGIIKEKYPDMDMISFGPTIMGAHSPDERVQISTVSKFWDILVDVLKNIPAK